MDEQKKKSIYKEKGLMWDWNGERNSTRMRVYPAVSHRLTLHSWCHWIPCLCLWLWNHINA